MNKEYALKVRKMANTLKHRTGIRYEETYPVSSVVFLSEKENISTKNYHPENIDEVIDCLVEYHKGFYDLCMWAHHYIEKEWGKYGYPFRTT